MCRRVTVARGPMVLGLNSRRLQVGVRSMPLTCPIYAYMLSQPPLVMLGFITFAHCRIVLRPLLQVPDELLSRDFVTEFASKKLTV